MIRSYQPGDHERIAEIFTRAVHEIAARVYTPAQCDAWSDKEPNPVHWEKRCAVKKPFVFVTNGTVVGFIEMDPNGHIGCMYVHPDHARKGIASRLIEHVVSNCAAANLSRLFVAASLCARPVFEKEGFHVVKEVFVEIGKERLISFEMELELHEGGGASASQPGIST